MIPCDWTARENVMDLVPLGQRLTPCPASSSLADDAVADAMGVGLIATTEIFLGKILEVRRIAQIGDSDIPERLSEFRDMKVGLLGRMRTRRLAAS
jgi:hypothetical protein